MRITAPRLQAAFAIILGATLSTMTGAFAQADARYPARPIRLIVAFPPGGAADLTARVLSQSMSESLKQPVLVENKPGANGVLGADTVAKSAPDGYTLLLTDRGALAINPSLYAKLPYDPRKDFEYVGIATEAPYVLVAHPSLGATNVRELIALAKAKPGAIAYGSYGIGSMPQFNLEAFSRANGIELRHIPYKGAAGAVQAVVAGEIGITITSAPAALGFLRDGRLRALAVGSSTRLALLPDIPTLGEAGVQGDLLLPTYFAVAAPAGTPAPIVARLHDEMQKALAAPENVQKLTASGLVPAKGSSREASAQVAKDIDYFAAQTKALGIKAE